MPGLKDRLTDAGYGLGWPVVCRLPDKRVSTLRWMQYLGTGATMDENNKSSALKGIIDPEHLLQAIDNSLQHSDETAHGVTGLSFKRYTITVRKKAGLSWSVECRFRKKDTDLSLPANKTLEITMPNTTKKTIVASIVQKTGVKPAEAKRALEAVLESIKLALASGRQVDLGKKLGKLKVVSRNPTRRINRNLKNRVTDHRKRP